MIMDWLRKAPTAVTVAVIAVSGVVALGVLGAYVLLEINGVNTTDFRQWIQTVGILLAGPLLGTTAVASVAAARSSSNAEDQTNGQLTALQRENAELRAQVQRVKQP